MKYLIYIDFKSNLYFKSIYIDMYAYIYMERDIWRKINCNSYNKNLEKAEINKKKLSIYCSFFITFN